MLKGFGSVALFTANKRLHGVGPLCKDRFQERVLADLDGRGVRPGCALCAQRTGQCRKCTSEPGVHGVGLVRLIDSLNDSRSGARRGLGPHRLDDLLAGLEVVHERREVHKGLHDAIELAEVLVRRVPEPGVEEVCLLRARQSPQRAASLCRWCRHRHYGQALRVGHERAAARAQGRRAQHALSRLEERLEPQDALSDLGEPEGGVLVCCADLVARTAGHLGVHDLRQAGHDVVECKGGARNGLQRLRDALRSCARRSWRRCCVGPAGNVQNGPDQRVRAAASDGSSRGGGRPSRGAREERHARRRQRAL